MEHVPHAPPNIRADFSMKAGIGYARFGNAKKSEAQLRQALEIAVAHDLHELVFRIEPILADAKECGAPEQVESAAPEFACDTASLKEVFCLPRDAWYGELAAGHRIVVIARVARTRRIGTGRGGKGERNENQC